MKIKFTLIALLTITTIFFFGMIHLSYAETNASQNGSQNVDRREYPRFKTDDLKTPVTLVTTNEQDLGNIIDLSRSGIALALTDANINVGDVIPVIIKYKGLAINTDLQIVFSNDSKMGAKFVNVNKNTEHQLLQLDILLEGENG